MLFKGAVDLRQYLLESGVCFVWCNNVCCVVYAVSYTNGVFIVVHALSVTLDSNIRLSNDFYRSK